MLPSLRFGSPVVDLNKTRLRKVTFATKWPPLFHAEDDQVEPVLGGFLCYGASCTLNSLLSELVSQSIAHLMAITVLQRLFPHKYDSVIVTSTCFPSRVLNISSWKLLQQ
jgi:hypothetical protein